MNVITNKNKSLGLAAGLFAGILFALLCVVMLPATAHAASVNKGGLVFTYDNEAGFTTANITEGDDGTIIVTGDVDLTVTQDVVGQGALATSIQLGSGVADGANYTGNMTVQNVTLAGNPAISLRNANTEQDACTLTLGENVTLMPPANSANEGGGVVTTVTNTDDTLIITGGVNITTNKTSDGSLVDLVGLNINGPGNQLIEFTGDANITANTQYAAILIGVTSVVTIQTDEGANPTISAVGSQPGNAIGVNPQGKVVNETSVQPSNLAVVFTGAGNLTAIGNSESSGATPAILFNGSTEKDASYTAIIEGPGTITAIGGNGLDSDSSAGGNGSVGIEIYNPAASGDAANPNAANLIIQGGTVIGQGGNGGASSSQAAGRGGYGFVAATNSTSPSSLEITGGNVTFAGGNAGSKHTGEAVGGGFGMATATYEADKTPNIKFTISNGTGENGTGPTLTTYGGFGTNGAQANAFRGFNAGTGAGTNIVVETGTSKGKDFYPFLAQYKVAGANNTYAEPAKLAGFAGMSDNGDVGTTFASTTVNAKWAQILPAPIESLGVGVVDQDDQTQAQYVVAQTNATMPGLVPGADYQYETTETATFTGIENLDTSNFGELLSETTNPDATFAPSENVGTTGAAEGCFYIVKNATGNTLTVNPADNAKVPKAISDLYPDITTYSSVQVPIVYTVTLQAGKSVANGANTAQFNAASPNGATSWNLYTNPNGDGTLVFGYGNANISATNAGTPEWPVASDAVAVTQLPTQTTSQSIPNTGGTTVPFKLFPAPSNPASPSDPILLGYYNETVTPMTQVATGQVSGYSSNQTYTAEWGTITLKSINPTPTTVVQGGTVDLTATYDVTSVNPLPSYSMVGAGVAGSSWQGIFVNQGTGNAAANGVYATVTSGATAEPEGTSFSVDVNATVTANADADTGHYRFWPALGQPVYTSGDDTVAANPGANPPTGIYASVEVTERGEGGIIVVRLSNPNTGEHLYTIDANEVAYLSNIGWANEGEAWTEPATSNMPIMRLYNPNNGDHMYTTSMNEYQMLQDAHGWVGEGQKLWSAPNDTGVDIFRMYNPAMTANGGAYAHLWTADYNEYQVLASAHGWQQEGVAWWALSSPRA